MLSGKAPGVHRTEGLDLLNIIMGWTLKLVLEHIELLWRTVFIVAVDDKFFPTKERISNAVAISVGTFQFTQAQVYVFDHTAFVYIYLTFTS